MKKETTHIPACFSSVFLLLLLLGNSLFAGVLWTANGATVCTAAGDQLNPIRPLLYDIFNFYCQSVTSDGSGGAIMVWQDQRSGGSDIYAQRIDSNGVSQWGSSGVAICTVAGEQIVPAIISDNAGGAIIAWSDQRGGVWRIYAQRINSAGSVQWAANGTSICTAAGERIYAKLATDGANGAIISWNNFNPTVSGGVGGVIAQKVSSAGSIQWAASGVTICAALGTNGDEASASTISDGLGGAFISWRDTRGGRAAIYIQYVNNSGVVQWTANGVNVSADSGNNSDGTKMALDGAGGVYVVSYKSSPSPTKCLVYLQRLNSSGVVQFAVGGVLIVDTTSFDASEIVCGDIVSDGSGNCIITWSDYRNGNADIYAQKVNSSGVAQWTANGIQICGASGDQFLANMTSDVSGGAIISWKDKRSGNYDIYSQFVSSSGTCRWTANGVVICNATGDQGVPGIISSGNGNAIITWNDKRSGNWDIYAQKVSDLLPPTIASISPNTGNNNTTVDITNLTGTSFATNGSNVTVKFTKSGQTDITATSVSVLSSTQITCTANLSGKYYGAWNVQVINPDTGTGTLTSGFTIIDVSVPTGAPTTPTDAGIYSSSTTITLNWTAGTSADAESGIAGYYLQVGTTVGENQKFDGDVGNVLTYAISGCSNGATYYARLSAKNGEGLYGSYSGNSDGVTINIDFVPPTVTSVSPSTGSNISLTTITITGAKFFAGTGSNSVTDVRFDNIGNTALSFSSANVIDTSINTAVVPSGIKTGAYNIKVSTAGGNNVTSTQKFVVTTPPPTVNTVGVLGGGSATNTLPFTISITGSGFFGGSASSDILQIKLDTSPTATTAITNSITGVSNTAITSVAFPLVVTPGTYNILITNSGGTNVTSSQKIAVYAVVGFDAGEVLLDDASATNLSVFATDSSGTKVIVPPGALTRDVKFLVTKDDTVQDGIAYKFRMKDNVTDALITNLLKPATITLYYTVSGGLVGNTGVTESTASTRLAIYYYDGVSWQKLVSVVNPFDKTVTTQTLKTGLYAIRAVLSYGDKVLATPNPFTPNNDGINDTVSFYFDNDNSDPTTIKIFNTKSDIIRTLANNNSWDGKTDAGVNAFPGLYFWQVEVNGAMKKRGSVILAR